MDPEQLKFSDIDPNFRFPPEDADQGQDNSPKSPEGLLEGVEARPLNKDFIFTFKQCLKDIEKAKTEPGNAIHLGPRYEVINNKGVNTKILTLMVSEPDRGTAYKLLAEDQDQRFVGMYELHTVDNDKTIELDFGYLNSGLRGAGIAAALCEARNHLLQTLADGEGKTVSAPVQDINKDNLEILRKQYLHTPSLENLALLTEKEDERVAWEKSVGRLPAQFAPRSKSDAISFNNIETVSINLQKGNYLEAIETASSKERGEQHTVQEQEKVSKIFDLMHKTAYGK